jgi:cytoskeletal protein CcmA (bactofilin family)
MGKKDKNNLSIIDKELKIDGSISSTGKLIIKGQVTGTIDSDVVIIAEDGIVNSSSTKVASLTIGGKFQGEVDASKELIILSTGTCSGKVECQDLIVENGGVLNAEVACKTAGNIALSQKDRPVFSKKGTPKIDNEKQIEL